MVLYIHGFASSGLGAKAEIFRTFYKNEKKTFLAPSLSFIPQLAMQTLEEIVQNCNDIKLVGSSLGGYYALYLSHKYDLKAVLINPSLHPQETLAKVLGKTYSFYDKRSGFFWQEEHVKALERYKVENPPTHNLFVLLQKGDETLDYRVAQKELAGAKMTIEEGGDHGFVGIECHFDAIEEFFA